MVLHKECKYIVVDRYLNIYPTESQKIFILEQFHFIMKLFIRRDEVDAFHITSVHRLSRMWLELKDTGSLTMMSTEDIELILANLKTHWSVGFLYDILHETKDNTKNDGGLFTLADQTVKALAYVTSS